MSSNTYPVVHGDETIELNRDERMILTYLINVMNGEEARTSDVEDYCDLRDSTRSYRLRERLEQKDLIEVTTIKGENEGTPLNDPKAWQATDKAIEVADATVLTTEEMTNSERIAQVEQKLASLSDDVSEEHEQTVKQVAVEIEQMRKEMTRLEDELQEERTKRQNLQYLFQALIREIDGVPDTMAGVIEESNWADAERLN